MSIQRVPFRAVQIQRLRREAWAEHLLITLGLAAGDRVTVEIDVEFEATVLRRAHDQTAGTAAPTVSDDHAR